MPSFEMAAPIHFVLCDFGPAGRAYMETDPDAASAANIVENLLNDQYEEPLQVIAVDLAANRVEDVSAAIAQAVLDEARRRKAELADDARAFVEDQLGIAIE
jgi:Mg/Co/Ni transporter MgtE